MGEKKLILAIETALKSGSLAILEGEKVIGSEIFGPEVSMSENLIGEIEKLLAKCGLKRNDLKIIAVSNGPGSLTGIRVGISAGTGLAYALGIDCLGISLLQAYRSAAPQQIVIAIVPAGKHQSYWQLYEGKNGGTISLIKNESVSALAEEYSRAFFVIHPDLAESLKNSIGKLEMICPQNAAEYVGKTAFRLFGEGKILKPEAIYFQENLYKKLELST